MSLYHNPHLRPLKRVVFNLPLLLSHSAAAHLLVFFINVAAMGGILAQAPVTARRRVRISVCERERNFDVNELVKCF